MALVSLFGYSIESSVILSLILIAVLAVVQLSWPRLCHWLKQRPAPRSMPKIHTFSSDEKPERRQRFKKNRDDIASWLQNAKKEDRVTMDDGEAIDISAIAHIRQQMIHRVMLTGNVEDNDENDASFKLDVINSIRTLNDKDVVSWWRVNRELLVTAPQRST
ncbi:hypothetical protein PYCC9005_001055 [Savitreella phatthalungensis]